MVLAYIFDGGEEMLLELLNGQCARCHGHRQRNRRMSGHSSTRHHPAHGLTVRRRLPARARLPAYIGPPARAPNFPDFPTPAVSLLRGPAKYSHIFKLNKCN
ncbi:hypothetical protein Y032_0253g252 [Ancylostoma ceylanicum]|uniref:Uncharacterized protein n=1 Tax=Ancylostoma ceylanicum TaxID=53326 RepID=A0A016SCJ3_9BILA|nr:hypothetical protein Y032_0253g252 [Ancylostoma ceylanicum]